MIGLSGRLGSVMMMPLELAAMALSLSLSSSSTSLRPVTSQALTTTPRTLGSSVIFVPTALKWRQEPSLCLTRSPTGLLPPTPGPSRTSPKVHRASSASSGWMYTETLVSTTSSGR